jgi:hypothetical protein
MSNDYNGGLLVNNQQIDLTPFPLKFFTNVTLAAALSLKGITDIKTLDLSINKSDTEMVINGDRIALTLFASGVIANTIKGLVSTFRGVDIIETVQIKIKANRSL